MSNPPAVWCPPRSIARFSAAVLSLSLLVVTLLADVGGVEEVEASNHDRVSEVRIESDSRSPAAITKYDVEFVTPHEIRPLQDSIVMVLDEDIGVPRAIAPNFVLVKYEKEGDDDDRANGFAAFVELDNQDDPRRPTRISIGHGLRENNSPKPIPAGATVTVTFTKAAGLSNPTEGGAYSWTVATVHDGEATDPVLGHHPHNYVWMEFTHIERVANHPPGDKEPCTAFWWTGKFSSPTKRLAGAMRSR